MMKLIVFAVERGLCACVRTPNDCSILIDCGQSTSGGIASPAQWVAENEKGDGSVSLIITHPHEHHLKDFRTVLERLSPTAFCCEADFNWPAITGSSSDSKMSVQAYESWLLAQKPNNVPAPDFGATVRCFSLSREEAEQLGGDEDRMLNNRSTITVISYKSDEGYSWKLVIAGDNQTDGWEALLAKPEFHDAVKETDFFITSDHGRKSGFCADLFKTMGKPCANISSSRAGGESVDARYRKSAQGVEFPDGSRTHLITPEDGNITVEMHDDGNYDVWLFRP